MAQAEFPLSAARVPDTETEARAFLEHNPECDGRGILVAIMDTGVDPGGPGLQLTSDGKPKLLDVQDCTGSGDVDTKTVRTATDGKITGLTGRTLTLNPEWSNPSGEWRVGFKHTFDLYSSRLNRRLKKERRELWEERHRGLAKAAAAELTAFVAEHPKPVVGEHKKQLAELEAREKLLVSMLKDYEDSGPVLDVIAWLDAQEVWRVVVSNEDGSLADATVLTDFHRDQKWGTFGEADQMNYGVNIFDNGDIVSIVCDSSPHGTHVAGITAGHHPGASDLNGVAPGAQLISLKIGDSRLGATETGTGLIRAFQHCVKMGVHLVNLSFGEAAAPTCTGRVIEMITETVAKHGIIFVTSAGNSGPGLGSVGAPGSGSPRYVTVGAHVSPAAMAAQYAVLDPLEATPYTWTSRGPTQDGSLGVTLCAPGSAITSVPNWTLAGNQLMNGTSMAAPNACGCIGLVLSGLKAAGLNWTPARVHRALLNTALAMKGPGAELTAVGAGMIQVQKCAQYLLEHQDLPYADVHFEVSIPGKFWGSPDSMHGIYLREPMQVAQPTTFTVSVTPSFPGETDDPRWNQHKVGLELHLRLSSSAEWVRVPDFLEMANDGRGFNVHVDPSELAPGQVHLAHVLGFDTRNPDAGPVFRVPVTVAMPAAPVQCPSRQTPPKVTHSVTLSAGNIERRFLQVPEGATWCELTLRCLPFSGGPRMFFVHMLQNISHLSFSKTDQDPVWRFETAGEKKQKMWLQSGATLEVAVSQFWSSLGDTQVECEVLFFGARPECSEVALSDTNQIKCVRVNITEAPLALKPTGSLHTLRRAVRASKGSITPCGDRDTYTRDRQVYQLVMDYDFEIKNAGQIKPHSPILVDKLYESVFESQLLMVYDANTQLQGVGDAWPEPIKLKKGKFKAKLQLRSTDVRLLEKMQSLALAVDSSLEKEIAVETHSNFNSCIEGGATFGTCNVRAGTVVPVYFSVPLDKAPLGDAEKGDSLLGNVSYCSAEPPTSAGKTDRRSHGGYLICYHFDSEPFDPSKKDKKSLADKEKEEEAKADTRSDAEKLSECIRDAKLEHLKGLRKLATREAHEALLGQMLEESPEHLPTLMEAIAAQEEIKPDPEDAADRQKRLGGLCELVNTLVAAIDTNALAAHCGMRVDQDDVVARVAGKKMDEKKGMLVSALKSMCTALGELNDADNLERTSKLLGQWVDLSDAKHLEVTSVIEQAAGNHALALSALDKLIKEEKQPKKVWFETRIKLMEQLGWEQWVVHERLNSSLRNLGQLALF